MRAILAACRRSRNLEFVGLLAAFAIVWSVEFQLLPYCLLVGPLLSLPVGFPGHLALLAMLGGAIFVWIAAHQKGFVSVATGAGFRIACLGVLCRLGAWSIPAMYGLESEGRSVYDTFPSIGGFIWLLRNIGLAAYAYGIVFVALSCWSECRLRRTAPAWVLPS